MRYSTDNNKPSKSERKQIKQLRNNRRYRHVPIDQGDQE
jgi:hypothetical protein